jgi:radical SAM superfamily enzyme YgiQ (UPF0313 family)
MPDILLIQPPIRDFYLTAKRTIPYGLASIGAALLQAGFTVNILDALATRRAKTIARPTAMAHLGEFYPQPDISPFGLFYRFKHFGSSYETIADAARRSGAWLIGISSLFSPYVREALETAEVVRAALPDAGIVLGGHHPTALPEQVLQHPSVDFVLRGDGELSLPLLAKALKTGRGIDTVPGLVRRDSGRTLTKEADWLDSPDGIPQPATELIDHRFYTRGDRGSAVITASRGCPMRCSYCCIGGQTARPYFRRPVAAILAEIERAVTQHRAGFIDFEDENLSLDRDWFLRLLTAVRRRYAGTGLELRAMNGLFPPSLDEGIISAMARAGFKVLNLSLGSTCSQQLKRFRRPDVGKAFDRALLSAEKHGLHAVGHVIAGGPDQRAAGSLADLLYLAERRVLAGISIFYPAPGSADFKRCQTMGLLPNDERLWRASALPLDHTTSRLESATILRLARILNFMKALLDRNLPIPPAEPYDTRVRLDIANRAEVGRQLLQWFLHDAHIRGVRPDGTVYTHTVSEKLTRLFLDGLQTCRVRGCK